MSMRLSMEVMMAVLVVCAAFQLRGQPAAQARRNQVLDGLAGLSGNHVNAALAEQGQSALADASDYDHTNSQLAEPARERSRLVLGRRQRFGTQRGFGV